MSLGCTHVTANNFDPNATVWDHSCVYLLKASILNSFTGLQEPACLLFKDVEEEQMENVSFTLSYSIEGKGWTFFHDYIPDFYFHTRERLFSLKDSKLYRHNTGPFGRYYEEDPKSFFIDVVFKDKEELILETVNWISTMLSETKDNSDRGSEWNTLTHITIWNSQQHTGRIPLSSVFTNLQYQTSRAVNGAWSFNHFRNTVLTRGLPFLQNLFKDYAVIPGTTGAKAWYDADLLQDKYFIVRFEFDNSSGKFLTLHETAVQAIKAKR